jgi:hypothetical protein
MEDPIMQAEATEAEIILKVEDGVEEADSSSDDELKKGKPNDDVREEDGDFIDTPMREFTYSGGIFSKQALAFNPLSSFIGIGVLWGLAIW